MICLHISNKQNKENEADYVGYLGPQPISFDYNKSRYYSVQLETSLLKVLVED